MSKQTLGTDNMSQVDLNNGTNFITLKIYKHGFLMGKINYVP